MLDTIGQVIATRHDQSLPFKAQHQQLSGFTQFAIGCLTSRIVALELGPLQSIAGSRLTHTVSR